MDGVLPGVFSVGENSKVGFALGNLRYSAGMTEEMPMTLLLLLTRLVLVFDVSRQDEIHDCILSGFDVLSYDEWAYLRYER